MFCYGVAKCFAIEHHTRRGVALTSKNECSTLASSVRDTVFNCLKRAARWVGWPQSFGHFNNYVEHV